MPLPEIKSPELINAARMAALHPATFSRPGKSKLDEITMGALVKVAVESEPYGERFWVEVMERNGDTFVGLIDNNLLYTASHGLRCDDLIRFHADHIYSTYEDDGPSHSALF